MRGARVEPREVEAAFEHFRGGGGAAVARALAVPLGPEGGGEEGGAGSTDGLALCVELRGRPDDDDDEDEEEEEEGGEGDGVEGGGGGDGSGNGHGGGSNGHRDASGGGVAAVEEAVELSPRRSAALAPALRRWAEGALPEPMVPSVYLVVRRLPSLPSGKPDRVRMRAEAPRLVARLLAVRGGGEAAARATAAGATAEGEGAAAAEAMRVLGAEMARALGLPGGAVRPAARFTESGGTSVVAARLSYQLRKLGCAATRGQIARLASP